MSVRVAGLAVRYPGRPSRASATSRSTSAGELVGLTGRPEPASRPWRWPPPDSSRASSGQGRRVRHVDGSEAGPAPRDGWAGGIVFSTPANQLSASKPTVREELAFGLENLGGPRESMDGRIEAVMTA